MWSTKIQLGDWSETIVEGVPTRSITWRTVFADKKSIRQSEFYAADNVGLKPEVMFLVHAHEYKGEECAKWNGVEFSILRTYENKAVTELVCGARVGDLNG